jgi:tetratricopeptide (TPR) repeat protein
MNRFAIALCALFAFNIAVAADAPDYGPLPAWVKPVESPATVASDGAPIKLLLADQQFNFLPQSQEGFFEDTVRIQTAQGLQALGTLQLPWKPDTDVLTIHKLHIIRGDQVIDALANGEKFTLLRRENNLEYSALDGILTAVFQPADLRVGDIVDLAFSIKRTDPILAGSAEQVAGGWIQGPYAHVHMSARWPSSSPVRWRLSEDLRDLKEQKDGDFTQVSYTADNIEPPVQARGAPLRFVVTRQIEFSGFKSWPDVSRRIAPLFAKAEMLAPDSPLKAEVARIRKVAHSPTELATAALRLVEDDVRYVFLGMNQGGIIPAPADLTWSRRFGDCKAKTVLLIALLHEFGISAEPVAVSTKIGDGLDARLPMISLFDHVIVRAHIGGQVYWLDGTRSADRHLNLLTTPNYHWGLPLLPAGSDLTRIEAVPLTAPSPDVHIRIDASGGIDQPAPFHVESVESGDVAIAAKLALASLTGDARDRALRQYWSKTYDFVDIKSVSANFDDDTETETVTMDGSARMVWKDRWYETDGLGVGFEASFTRDAGANMQAPYTVTFPTYARTSETILLPISAVPFTTSGKAVDRVVGGVEYKRTFNIIGWTFTGEASMRSIQQEFPAAEAAEAQAALRDMAKDGLYLRSPDQAALANPATSNAPTFKLPSSGEYVARGNKLLDSAAYDGAIGEYDTAIAIDPQNAYALANRGLAYLFKGESDKAVSDWKAADAINPNNEVAPRGRGVLAYNAGNYTEAIADFTQSLERLPNNHYTLAWRARAFAAANRTAEQIADDNQLIKLFPESSEAYADRAAAQVRAGHADAAIADARALIASNDKPVSYRLAATIFWVAGRNDEALHAVSHVLDVSPTEQDYLLRASLRPKADYAGRHDDIGSALQLNPRSIRALYGRVNNEFAAGHYADAEAAATAIIEVDGAKSEYLVLRGLARAKSNQIPQSEQDFRLARAAAPNLNVLNNYCWSLATHNVELSEALSACEEVVAKSRGDADDIDSKAFVLLRLGRYSDSIATYDAALAINPKLAASLYGRGLAKLRAGDQEGSRRDIAAALASNKDVADQFADYGLKPSEASGGKPPVP